MQIYMCDQSITSFVGFTELIIKCGFNFNFARLIKISVFYEIESLLKFP